MNQDCACLCGASRFTVAGNPIGRFFCHCKICQTVYRKPFADVTCFWASSINVPSNQQIEFRRYRPPPALRRGVCEKCGNPVVGFLGFVPGFTLAFVPSQNFPRPTDLPKPERHIFYDRRVADVYVGKIMGNDVPMVPLYQRPTYLVYKTSVKGMVDNSSSQGPSFNAEAWSKG